MDKILLCIQWCSLVSVCYGAKLVANIAYLVFMFFSPLLFVWSYCDLTLHTLLFSDTKLCWCFFVLLRTKNVWKQIYLTEITYNFGFIFTIIHGSEIYLPTKMLAKLNPTILLVLPFEKNKKIKLGTRISVKCWSNLFRLRHKIHLNW